MPLCYVGKATKIFMVVVAVVVVTGLVLGLAVFRHRNSDDRRQGHGRNPTFAEPIPAAATSSPGTMHPTPPPPFDVPSAPIDANTPPIPEPPPSLPPPPAQTSTPLPEAPPTQTTAPVPEPPPAVTPPSPPADDGGTPLPPMASPSMEGVGTPGPIGR